jgi:integrase
LKRRQPLRRVWWLVLLLTGARARSVCRLEWRDVDFDAGLIHFRAAKGGRPYTVPMAERLKQVLLEYRELKLGRGDWVFPSQVRPGAPLFDGRDGYEAVAGVSPHRMRHTMRTRLAGCGATPDLARVALGHALTRDISSGYITAKLLVEAVQPLVNAVAERGAQLLGW